MQVLWMLDSHRAVPEMPRVDQTVTLSENGHHVAEIWRLKGVSSLVNYVFFPVEVKSLANRPSLQRQKRGVNGCLGDVIG